MLLPALAVLSAAWVLFAWAGYPALCWVVAYLRPRPVAKGEVASPLSVIIAVHNGEAEIEKKLEHTLALEYPGEVEVIVASDGSTDRTEEVARAFAGRGVQLVRNPERQGKEAAQARAIAVARGEILVFTDVGARLEPGALRAIARPFADPQVACVSSEDVVPAGGGEGAYVRFEMWLRRMESEAGSVPGVSGSFFAVRRELARPWPADLASDFRSALEAARRGLRAVCEPEARARFGTAREPGAEWQRKVRTVRRGLAVLSAYRDLLDPRRGQIAFALWGHKVARFTTPFALLLLFAASAAAAPAASWAAWALGLQVAAVAFAGLALAWPRLGASLPGRLASFFALVNAAMLVAWIHHLRGERAVVWEPTRR